MAIKKHEEIRLNVKPIFLTLYHEYVFEGPCRFGEGIQLEKEFDLHMAAEKFKGWYAQLQAAMPENVVNLLEPVKVERDENFLTKDEMIDKLAEGSEEVDLYFIGYASRPYDLALEFAQRVGKPCAITQACCASAITSAEFLARGLEFYSFEDWEDATEYMTVLRARKVMKDSKILAATRMTSTVSVSAPDSTIDPEKITERFGTRIRYVSAHELLDQISYDDPMENYCTPGRKGLNLTAEDEKIIDKETDELIAGAEECEMTREMVKKSVEANYGIQKFLDAYECNCFTAPCPDLCATRRLNQKQFTMCLNHSLNNEQGIPSACEYDLGAVVSKLMLQAIGRRPSYMGNCFTSPVRHGVRAQLPKALFFTPEHVDQKMEEPRRHPQRRFDLPLGAEPPLGILRRGLPPLRDSLLRPLRLRRDAALQVRRGRRPDDHDVPCRPERREALRREGQDYHLHGLRSDQLLHGRVLPGEGLQGLLQEAGRHRQPHAAYLR